MMTFSEWMQQVNVHVWGVAGLSADDLADQTWRDWFDDQYTPREAALKALENEGYSQVEVDG